MADSGDVHADLDLAKCDLDPASILKTGEVTHKGQLHSLTLHQAGLRLDSAAAAQRKTAQRALELPWCDVLHASCDLDSSKGLTLHHVVKTHKTNKLRCATLKLAVDSGSCKEWADVIEQKQKQVSGRPQKVLVIINPIGGKGQGLKVFESQVRPLLSLAGTESIVKVTDHYKHGLEIASSFDLCTVDGVVVCGGDGLYAEILHGMMLQSQEKAGVDPNDSSADLTPPPVPIALIPTGTGNGVSGWINGDVIDVVTATLNIVRGQRTKVNMITVYDNNKLVHCCGLRLAYGFYAQIMKRTDDARWMKRARYPYALLSSPFWRKHLFDLEVEILQAPSPEDQGVQRGDGDGVQGAHGKDSSCHDNQLPNWVTLGGRRVSSLLVWCAGLQLSELDHMVFNPFSPHTDLILDTSTGSFHLLNSVFKMALRKKDMFDPPCIERYSRVLGVRFRYTGERSKGENSGGAVSERELLSRTLDVDGELTDSGVTSAECRFHSQFVPVFGIQYVPK